MAPAAYASSDARMLQQVVNIQQAHHRAPDQGRVTNPIHPDFPKPQLTGNMPNPLQQTDNSDNG